MAFAEIFSQVHVLTSDNYKRFPQEKRSLPDNIAVHELYTLDYRTAMGGSKGQDAHISMRKKSTKGFQYLLKVQKSYPFSMILGEGNLIYQRNAFKKACKIIEEHNITTIYSSFAPYVDHMIAHKLKKKYPHLKWIADFRDLQVEPIYDNVVWKNLQRHMEKRVLSNADKVVSVSGSYADQLGRYGRPTQSIMRGVSLRDAVKQYDKFTISYTGSLYFDYRNPGRLLLAISELIEAKTIDSTKMQLIYAGRDGAQFGEYVQKFGLSKIFLDRGMVMEKEAKEIQSRSHVNLLLTSSSPELQGVITGKIFEYFEAGNPIICLINGVRDSEFEQLFSKLSAGIVTYDPPIDPASLRNFIITKYQEMQLNGSVQHIINKSTLIEEYSWMSQAKKMLAGI